METYNNIDTIKDKINKQDELGNINEMGKKIMEISHNNIIN